MMGFKHSIIIHNKPSIFLLKTVIGFTSLSLLGVFMSYHRRFADSSPDFQKFTTQQTTKADGVIFQARKHVTKSLRELGTMRSISDHILMVNTIPNAGSELLVLLLQKLQGRNNFKHVRLKNSDGAGLDNYGQESMIDEISDIIRKNAVPLSIDRNMYFLNFTKYGKQSPMFSAMVRNPIDLFFARFRNYDGALQYRNLHNKSQAINECFLYENSYCKFEDLQEYEMQINYFCGNDYRCKQLNNDWALSTAKKTVEKYFPVVGIIEDVSSTFALLEQFIPYFFGGVKELYADKLIGKPKFIRPKLKKRYETYIRYSLRNEIDFYEWLFARLRRDL